MSKRQDCLHSIREGAAPDPAVPPGPTRAAVWHDQPEVMRWRALAVLTYLGQVARQVGPEQYTDACVRALGLHVVRMVGALRTAADAANEQEYVTFALSHCWLSHPVDLLHAARECLIVVAEHHEFGEDLGDGEEEDAAAGCAALIQMALAFLKDAESEFDRRPGRVPSADAADGPASGDGGVTC